MGNFKDFDLDTKITVESGNGEQKGISISDIVSTVVSSVLTGCTPGCTEYCTKHCSEGCPVPSIDYPHHSCRMEIKNGVQNRC